MTFRHALLATVTASALLAGASADAANTKRHVRRTTTVTRTTTAPAGGLSEEVRELRAQVQALRSRLDSQSTEVSAATQQSAAQVQALQTQVAAANARVDAVPTQVAAQIDTATEKAHHADRFFFKGITITPGGFLELAGIYRQQNQQSDIATGFNQIPYRNNRVGRTEEFRFSARQSRVSFLAAGDVSKTLKLAMYGEFDFQGAAQTANSNETNSYNPRIRNLYGTVDYASPRGYGFHLLAGQNWSLATLNSKGITPRNEVTPPQIDAQYVPGFVFARQPGVRLTADVLNHKLWFAVAAENPQTTFVTPQAVAGVPGAGGVPTLGTTAPLPGSLVYNATGQGGFNSANTLSLNHVPDIIGKVAAELTVRGHGIHVEGFGIYKDLYYRVGGVNRDRDAGGIGGSISATIIPKFFEAQFSYLQGRGIGRYGASQLPETTFDATGSLTPIREQFLLAGGTIHLGKKIDVYGFAGEEIAYKRGYVVPNAAAPGTFLAYGYGIPQYQNQGCFIEGNAACIGQTHSIKQITGGIWDRFYQGSFGRAQVGLQYSYTERQSFGGVGGAPNARNNIGFVSFRYYPF